MFFLGTRRRQRERGAVVMLTSIFLGGAVLLGSGALVVDVGQLYAEREELQSGADAAALAVARACAANVSTCNANSRADAYADANAKDNHSTVTVCGSPEWGLSACVARTGLAGCIGTPPTGTYYAEVRTYTETADGSNLLPPALSRSFVGSESFEGTQVAACARAVATPGGAPVEMDTPAVIFEQCFWTDYTASGTDYSTTERYLPLKGATSGSCGGRPSNGQNGPGNFGWLDHDGDCLATVSADGPSVGGDTGNNTDDECVELFDEYIDSGEPMPLPLFDTYTGSGSNLEYHVTGFAAFRITGYDLGNHNEREPETAGLSCPGHGNDGRCIFGYFVEGTFPIIRTGGTDYGVTGAGSVKVVG